MNIKQHPFALNQYFQEEHKKTQIYLHHTAGNPNPYAVYQYWATTKDRVATCVTIGGKPDSSNTWDDGLIVQGYTSKHWGYHLGLQGDTFKRAGVKFQWLDKISIGVEVCNWGQITYKNGKYYTYVNREIASDQVQELIEPYKGHKLWHKYTDAQIESVRQLLVLWNKRYSIPINYNPDIWSISKRALSGEPGVYTHNSVRRDKSDIYPCPKMIAMLKSL
jgi:hypothetical protein